MTEKEFKEKLNRKEMKLIEMKVAIVPVERIYRDMKTGECYRELYDTAHLPIIKLIKLNFQKER